MKYTRTVGPAIGLALVLGTATYARVREGRRALLEAEAATERGDMMAAILAARFAAEARCPLCDAPARGYAKLGSLAKEAEARGDDGVAFAAFRAMRAASLATDGDRRAHAEAELARLGRKLDATRTSGGTPTAAASPDKLAAALADGAREDRPQTAALALAAAGALAFFAGALRWVRQKEGVADVVVGVAGLAVAALGVAFF